MNLQYRRKREGKTNYKKRLTLLKSRMPRLVVRVSNRYIIMQIVKYYPDGDKVLMSASSSELKKKGWNYSCKNLPAAYLTGLMLSKKGIKEELILDVGIKNPAHGSKIYSAVKGAVDGGLNVKVDKKVFPDEKRISGEHISENVKKDFETLKEKVTS